MIEVTPQPNEITLVLPNELTGEPGDEFTPEFQAMLRSFARMQYWPNDFGEADSTHTTLYLVKGTSVEHALSLCESFIACGGDV